MVVDRDGPDADETEPFGSTVTVPVDHCARSGPDTWKLSGADFTGYAVRGDDALLTVAEDGNRDDDLAAVAATLHPLDDHSLWPHLSNPLTWTWRLS